jgi:hypothetical protein
MHAYYLLFCNANFQKMRTNQTIEKQPTGHKKSPEIFRACGDKWTRTTDSRIFSPMLYQLSYITDSVKVLQM